MESVEILAAEICPDHVYMLVDIRENSGIGLLGIPERKSSLMIYEQFGNLKFKYRNRDFGVQRVFCRHSGERQETYSGIHKAPNR